MGRMRMGLRSRVIRSWLRLVRSRFSRKVLRLRLRLRSRVRLLERLMLAQTQECVFQNAISGGKSPGACSQLAPQVGLYYEEAYAALDVPPLNKHLDRTWMSHVQLKAAQFYAEACYRDGLELHEKKEIGEEIASLESGINALADAKKSTKGVGAQLLDAVNRFEGNMKSYLDRTEKQNDRAYPMRVPAAATLSPLPTRPRVTKYMSMISTVLDASKEKLFVTLVPDSSAKSRSRYTEMVDDIRTQADKLQQASELTRVRLKEMVLADSLFALEGNVVLPIDRRPVPPASASPPAVTPASTTPQTPAAAPVAPTESNVYDQAASNLVAGNNFEDAVQQILHLGGGIWDREIVVHALRATYNKPLKAVEYICSGIPEQAETAAPVAWPPASGQAANPPPAQATQPAQLAVPSSGPKANPLDLFPQGLPSMGSNTAGVGALRLSTQQSTVPSFASYGARKSPNSAGVRADEQEWGFKPSVLLRSGRVKGNLGVSQRAARTSLTTRNPRKRPTYASRAGKAEPTSDEAHSRPSGQLPPPDQRAT